MRTRNHRCLAFFSALLLLLAAFPATAQDNDGLSGSQQRRLSSLSTRITSIEERLRALSKRSERLSEKIFKKNFFLWRPSLAHRLRRSDRLHLPRQHRPDHPQRQADLLSRYQKTTRHLRPPDRL